MFENRIMREMFGLKWEEVTGNWRKLRNEELHDLYSSQNITEVMWHVWGEKRCTRGFWWRKLKTRDNLEDPTEMQE